MSNAYNFFRSWRMILALNPNNLSLGGIIIDIIENIYLPNLKNELSRESDEGKREELMELIDIWEDYGNPRGTGKIWNKEAAKVLVPTAKKFGISDSFTLEDVASEVMRKIWMGEWKARLNDLKNYDYEKGPMGLIRFWKEIVYKGVVQVLNTPEEREWRGLSDLPSNQETGEELPVADPKEWSPGTATEEQLVAVMADMQDEIRSQLKPNDKFLFDLWGYIADKKYRGNWKNVKNREDLLEAYENKTGNGETAMVNSRKKIERMMLQYFEKKFKRKFNRTELKKMKLANRVAMNFWMPRFAAWMLELHFARRNFIASL